MHFHMLEETVWLLFLLVLRLLLGVFVACLTLPPLGGAVTPLPELTDQIKKYADNMSGAAMFVQHWNRAVDDQKSLFPDIGENQ